MQKAEEFVKSWHSSWWEQCLEAYSMSLYNAGMSDVENIEQRYSYQYVLQNVYYPENRTGEPLRKVILEDGSGKEYECEFGRIEWYDMNSRKSSRHFSFNNNGTIEFSKSTLGQNQTLRHPRRVYYDTSFNVLSNDFEISITYNQLTDDWREKYKYDYLPPLTLKDNILIERLNDIEIKKDINTGTRLVKIVKSYDKKNIKNNVSLEFEARLNPDDSLEYGGVALKTHKGNGKVNGIYRFDVNRKKGVRANFYSRNGVKADLTNNSLLLDNANTLILSVLSFKNNNNSGDVIVSDFNMETVTQAINQTDKRIIDMIKCFRGELPLAGLLNRIDSCIEMIDKKQSIQTSEEPNSKLLKFNKQ